MDDSRDPAEAALEAIERIVSATAEFKAAGVPSRAAEVLIYDLRIRSLAELRAIPWDDADGRPGLRAMLRAAWRCGPLTTKVIRELHDQR